MYPLGTVLLVAGSVLCTAVGVDSQGDVSTAGYLFTAHQSIDSVTISAAAINPSGNTSYVDVVFPNAQLPTQGCGDRFTLCDLTLTTGGDFNTKVVALAPAGVGAAVALFNKTKTQLVFLEQFFLQLPDSPPCSLTTLIVVDPFVYGFCYELTTSGEVIVQVYRIFLNFNSLSQSTVSTHIRRNDQNALLYASRAFYFPNCFGVGVSVHWYTDAFLYTMRIDLRSSGAILDHMDTGIQQCFGNDTQRVMQFQSNSLLAYCGANTTAEVDICSGLGEIVTNTRFYCSDRRDLYLEVGAEVLSLINSTVSVFTIPFLLDMSVAYVGDCVVVNKQVYFIASSVDGTIILTNVLQNHTTILTMDAPVNHQVIENRFILYTNSTSSSLHTLDLCGDDPAIPIHVNHSPFNLVAFSLNTEFTCIGPVTSLQIIPDIISLLVTWKPPILGSKVIMNYMVCNDLNCILLDDLRQAHKIRNLQPNTTYTVTVWAQNNRFEGMKKEEKLSTNHIGKVEDVQVWVINENSVNVSWSRLDSMDISEYQVSYNVTKREEEGGTTVDGNVSSASVNILKQAGLIFTFQVSAIVLVNGDRIQGPPSLVTNNTVIIIPTNTMINDILVSASISMTVTAFVASILVLSVCILCKKKPWKNIDHIYDKIHQRYIRNRMADPHIYERLSIEHDYDQIPEYQDTLIDTVNHQQSRLTRSCSLTNLCQFNQEMIRFHSLTNLIPLTSHHPPMLTAGPPLSYHSLNNLCPPLPPRNNPHYHSLSSLINNLRERRAREIVDTDTQYHSLSSLINSLRERRAEPQYQRLLSIDAENMYQPLIRQSPPCQSSQLSPKGANDEHKQDQISNLSSFGPQNGEQNPLQSPCLLGSENDESLQ